MMADRAEQEAFQARFAVSGNEVVQSRSSVAGLPGKRLDTAPHNSGRTFPSRYEYPGNQSRLTETPGNIAGSWPSVGFLLAGAQVSYHAAFNVQAATDAHSAEPSEDVDIARSGRPPARAMAVVVADHRTSGGGG